MGKLVFDRNPENYFADVEQLAFDPAHMVPGIEPSPDKMLQGRLFAYADTHRHRLGPNHLQLPVNCPYKVSTPFDSINHMMTGIFSSYNSAYIIFISQLANFIHISSKKEKNKYGLFT